MSSISGVSASGFAQTRAVRQDNDADDQQRAAAFSNALLAAGANTSNVNTIQAQIQKAIDDAVKNGGQKPDQATIKNAVDGVLKANGLDAAKFSESLQASRQAGGAKKGHHKHHGHKPAQVQQQETQATQTDPSRGNQIDTAA